MGGHEIFSTCSSLFEGELLLLRSSDSNMSCPLVANPLQISCLFLYVYVSFDSHRRRFVLRRYRIFRSFSFYLVVEVQMYINNQCSDATLCMLDSKSIRVDPHGLHSTKTVIQ